MILYLETSRLVKLYVREPGSEAVRRAVDESEAVATSVISFAEARAAFARKLRDKGVSGAAHTAIKESLLKDWPSYFVLNVTTKTAHAAGDLAEIHGLRGFAALHLASAMELRSAGVFGLVFSTADARLAEAARLEGFPTA